MQEVLSCAYRIWFLLMCDMPPALSSAYRFLGLVKVRYALGIKPRLSQPNYSLIV
ncbi:hypothetical protein [Brunnivagina elsteri]|uniref:hypothetical protein n=1 Tax=Brunnivagina elsteri TaxID=1247191 RepID=UPI001B801A44|nr:hypothetical protein [Calothrix elsteri]